MKRLIFCFDGTWNKLDADNPTNVVWTAESITPVDNRNGKKITQIIHYDQGVGTEKGERFGGGLFGRGLLQNLSDAYRFLIFNYEIEDEIYVFGFSRGAFSARSFVGLIRNCGILERRNAGKITEAVSYYKCHSPDKHPNSRKTESFRNEFCKNVPSLKIKYLGVWDTVGSLGVPKNLFIAPFLNKKYMFHDTRLSSFVENARHAVAIDEERKSFSPTLWSNFDELNQKAGKSIEDYDAPYQQKWFPGTHGSVGGGGSRRGLSDQAMDWVLDGARMAGLKLDSHSNSRIYELKPDYTEHIENYVRPRFLTRGWLTDFGMTKILSKENRLPGPQSIEEVSVSAVRRWQEKPGNLKDSMKYRPKTLSKIAKELDGAELIKPLKLAEGTYSIYEVKVGDTLSHIARSHYGDANKWEVIFRANADKIDHPDKIYAGMNLKIPQVEK